MLQTQFQYISFGNFFAISLSSRPKMENLSSFPTLQCPCIYLEWSRNRAGYCICFLVVNTEFEGALLLRCENNGRYPLGLSRIDDFPLPQTSGFILFDLPRFGSSSIWGKIGILKLLFDSMLGCLESSQSAIPDRLQF